ncbi:MAG TPA: hypothetical protein VEI57_07175 [Nitrospirota bacterium]|nr:hypothetical protein [Nitrospirota bacterium]
MPSEMRSYAYATNGISSLDIGQGCSLAEGDGAGGLASDTPGLELQNGITCFNVDRSSFAARNSWGESELSSGPTRDNGVTIF